MGGRGKGGRRGGGLSARIRSSALFLSSIFILIHLFGGGSRILLLYGRCRLVIGSLFASDGMGGELEKNTYCLPIRNFSAIEQWVNGWGGMERCGG